MLVLDVFDQCIANYEKFIDECIWYVNIPASYPPERESFNERL